LDDAEFTGIANAFQASFVDVTAIDANYNDFYRTIVHEIGHAMGIAASPGTLFGFAEFGGLISNRLIYSDRDQNGFADLDGHSGAPLRVYSNTATGVTVTLTSDGGGHFYEGHANDPAGLLVHPDQLMNPGRTVPPDLADPIPTTRQFISDLTVRLLADAYGYGVTLPSNVVIDPDVDADNTLHTSSMHTTFDSQTGTLLLQGGPIANNDTFSIVPDGDEMVVTVSYFVGGTFFDFVSRFKSNTVSQIVIAGNGGTDTVSVNAAYSSLVKQVQYVVSSNQDSTNAGTLGDGLVDLDAAVPGNQVALRAGIRDANGGTVARSIYVPRGNYRLAVTGTGADTTANHRDLDIAKNITIIGTGAGESVIDAGGASGIGDRVFDVQSGGSLTLDRLTVTGGYLATGPGAGVQVWDDANLTVIDSAFVGNNAVTDSGGAIFRYLDGNTTIRRSVFTGNNAGVNGGAIRSNGQAGVLTIGESIFANNTAGSAGPNLHRGASNIVNEGNNLVDDTSGDSGFFDTGLGDHIGTAAYVVTDLGDSYDGLTDLVQMSTRDAVSLANGTVAADEIWLPAWKFRLTHERTTASNMPEMDVSQGDLEIMNDLTIRGVNGSTSVAWRAGAAVDKVFELVGDYNSNGTVDTADNVLWHTSDGDDDGAVGGQGDYDAWADNYDSTFTKIGVMT
jgi:predicted outer membrane repeat protein